MMKNISLILLLLSLYCCGRKEEIIKENVCEADLSKLADAIKSKLEAYDRDADFTLLLASENGNSFDYSVGNSTSSSSYKSASTSKWVTAAVILSLVEDGKISLNDNPQDYIDFWPTIGTHAAIELKHLLSFTSGLIESPICINLPNSNIESCVLSILNKNPTIATPGAEFYYASAHMQVAGLMAIKAAGFDTWEGVFTAFKTKTGLFANSSYDLPSLQNPRLAGGMHWTGEDYMEFLEAIYYQKILTPELIATMQTDMISNATIVFSPSFGVLQDWHYGLGNWIECNSITFNCTELNKFSSPGAYGAYPFIDYEHQYYGILSRQGELNTFVKGYNLFASIESELKTWAGVECKL